MMNPLPCVDSSDSLCVGYKQHNLSNQPQHLQANFTFLARKPLQEESEPAQPPTRRSDACCNPILENCITQLKSARETLGEDHKEAADYWSALGLCRMHTQRDMVEALPCFEKSLRIYRKNQLRRDVANTLLDVGICLERMDRTTEALEKYQEAMSIFEALQIPETHPQVWSTKRALARLGRS
jgi:tetratricopeptide (TPR) repeat protein